MRTYFYIYIYIYIYVKLWFTTMFYVGVVLCWLYSIKKVLYLHYFVPCILWDFIVLGWWRIKHETKNQCNFATNLREEYPVKKGTWEAHAESWRVMLSCWFCECLAGKAFLWNTRETFCLDDFKCDFLTLHPYYIYSHYPQKYRRLFREKNSR